jgi:hypothetical protein
MGNYPQSIPAGSGRAALSARTRYPVVYWAAATGAVLLAFEIYVLINWVTGPNFVRVPYGPSELPNWMKLVIDISQPLWIAGTAWFTWSALLRPWLRERRVTTWGLMWPVMMLTSVYDTASNYFHNWFGYNAYFLNFGNPLPGALPGWLSFAEPGAMHAWPVIFVPCVYPFLFIFTAWACKTFMAAVRGRMPRIPTTVLIGLTLVFGLMLDIVFEGLLMMPLGWYVEAGHSVLSEGEYYQLPWRNAIAAAFVFTTMGSLFYFRDDHGHTFVERGLERFTRNSSKVIALRFLALLAAMQFTMIGMYHVPLAFFEKHFPAHWPESIASKSYFNDHMCGYDTPRPCP